MIPTLNIIFLGGKITFIFIYGFIIFITLQISDILKVLITSNFHSLLNLLPKSHPQLQATLPATTPTHTLYKTQSLFSLSSLISTPPPKHPIEHNRYLSKYFHTCL